MSENQPGCTRIYCYAGPTGTDPQEIVLVLSDEDVNSYFEAKAADSHLDRNARPETWVKVTDQETGKRWMIAAVSCSADCRCACEAIPAETFDAAVA